MSRKFFLVLLITLFLVSQSVFSQDVQSGLELRIPAFNSVTYFAAEDTDIRQEETNIRQEETNIRQEETNIRQEETNIRQEETNIRQEETNIRQEETNIRQEDTNIPQSIRNNEFYLESVRLTKLAQDTFEYGDYDASSGFAEEAIRYAQLSDQYVADQLIGEAKRLLDWADSNNIAERYSNDYNESKNYYETSVLARSNEEWAEAIEAAIKSINILAAYETTSLPSQYTVRTWSTVRDCLWNIAGYSWVYGDPERWRDLYEANKAKLPNPDNPNLIEPGTIIDIPSIRGEVRRGMWQPGRNYVRP